MLGRCTWFHRMATNRASYSLRLEIFLNGGSTTVRAKFESHPNTQLVDSALRVTRERDSFA
jgi:hypothetical protein